MCCGVTLRARHAWPGKYMCGRMLVTGCLFGHCFGLLSTASSGGTVEVFSSKCLHCAGGYILACICVYVRVHVFERVYGEGR